MARKTIGKITTTDEDYNISWVHSYCYSFGKLCCILWLASWNNNQTKLYSQTGLNSFHLRLLFIQALADERCFRWYIFTRIIGGQSDQWEQTSVDKRKHKNKTDSPQTFTKASSWELRRLVRWESPLVSRQTETETEKLEQTQFWASFAIPWLPYLLPPNIQYFHTDWHQLDLC